MFTKVLIANRGAIAVRIERTLRKMGVKSVAVYTKADQDSLHVDGADEALLIGEGPVKDSYLNSELILKTALATGAQAIHPGYGFLSENAQFAKDCRKHGLVFIGPTPEQMEAFGLKHRARAIAEKAMVPLLPGTGLITDLADAIPAAKAIGYPVMLKSTAGGGGIGMRICRDEPELLGVFESVRHLARTHFKDGGMFLEKYIVNARHIEVQVFGNAYGEIVALGERDCSVQRRNQKIVEESPAPNLAPEVRADMHQAAIRLLKEVGYRSAGTVEFLYDSETGRFYFLEVNTRLQVEHGVTEAVYGVDLVEWMLLEAAGELRDLTARVPRPRGNSFEARIYAEDCFKNFAPSAGRIDQVNFPGNARVETWVRDTLTLTTLYDPMLAKIIVHGETRAAALAALKAALEQTKIYGITTNVQYLQSLLETQSYREADLSTHMLNDFTPEAPALEVLDGGIQTTVQDYPGRTGFWDVGVPPCGPMDSFSFRIGNILLGNAAGAPGLEMTLKGGSYRFRGNAWFCLTGADMDARLDGQSVPRYQPVRAQANQVLVLKEAAFGMRSYLLIGGGFDVPEILGSSATFTLGGFGGFGGRAVRAGDVLMFRPHSQPESTAPLPEGYQPALGREWEIGVVPGPHCVKEFLQNGYLEQLTSARWEVHFNSSRTGIRLIGPTPSWSREDGGEAGLHPSNLHDNAYAIGALDMTGDMPILLGPDGPSLGGFVCPVTAATAELWKIGQLKPGDKVKFLLLSLEEAEGLRMTQENFLRELAGGSRGGLTLAKLPGTSGRLTQDYPVLYANSTDHPVAVRVLCAGDENVLVEYGPMELDLRLRFRAHALMEAVKSSRSIPYLDLTPGIRSLQIHIDRSQTTVKETCRRLIEIEKELPPLESVRVPSRIVHLPLSWDDPATRLAIERYHQNVRKDAPWCPSNLEFIRRINGLDSIDEVRRIVFDATYLVLGLGDVYLGAPVATPVDPRHRLVTTKYNPARTWTPENAVGIGGAYLCVYGMEGPGGYQFVGRTVQMWNKYRPNQSFGDGQPWLLRFFDQIKFYPVTAQDLLKFREDFTRGKFAIKIEATSFDLGGYLKYLDDIKESAAAFKRKQQAAFQAERDRWRELGLAEFVAETEETESLGDVELPPGTEGVRARIPGSVWKVLVEPGQEVKTGDTLMIIESMKMEFAQPAHCDGTVGNVMVKAGDIVNSGQVILGIASQQRSGVK
jgi:urea carboxylase